MIENKTDYTNPLLVEDDAAPDARQYFESKFKKLMKCSVEDFKKKAEKHDVVEGWIAEWLYDDVNYQYCLTFDMSGPFYTFYMTEIEI